MAYLIPKIKGIAFSVHMQGTANKHVTLRSINKNHFSCILVILQYFKHIEIYIHQYEVYQKGLITKYGGHGTYHLFTGEHKENYLLKKKNKQ